MLTPCTRKVLAGQRISREEALGLAQETPLLLLGAIAKELRRRRVGEETVTFLVDRNINYSNICIAQCRFCAFHRDKEHPEAYLLTVEQLHQKIQEAVDHGATRILLQGGLHPDLTIEYFEAMFAFIKERFSIDIDGLSAAEITHIAGISGLTIEATLQRLWTAGLDGVPGAGAEILDNTVRSRVSPKKIPWQQWAAVMAAAQDLDLTTTATMVFGMGEDLPTRLLHLDRLRTMQDNARARGKQGFISFIPWAFQPGNTEMGGEIASALEYLQVVALSRIMLDNFSNIQCSWVTQGPRLAQVALEFGANDFGSTMMEENVVGATGVSMQLDLNEITGSIRQAGYIPVQRTSAYTQLHCAHC